MSDKNPKKLKKKKKVVEKVSTVPAATVEANSAKKKK